MAYCTQTDLEYAVGGAAILVQLLDKDGDGISDEGYVVRILNRATAEVASAVRISTSLESLELSSYPDALVYTTANIAAYYAFLEGTSGQGLPQHIRDNYQDSLRWLDQVARRERTLGESPKVTTDLQVRQVDPDPYSRGVSRAGLKGFW
jgi:phage gp36-like protein